MKRLAVSASFRKITALSYLWLLVYPILYLTAPFTGYGWDSAPSGGVFLWLLLFLGYLAYTFHVCCVALSTASFLFLLFLRKEQRFEGYGKALLSQCYPIVILLFLCGKRIWYFFAYPFIAFSDFFGW